MPQEQAHAHGETQTETQAHAHPSGVGAAWRTYADSPEDVPMAGYAATATVFSTGLAIFLAVGTHAHLLPRRWSTRDLLLTGVAVHRLTRIVTRDKAAIPLRAPFTHYEGMAGAGEVRERARGTGVRRAIGTLLTCPYCAAPWIATAFFGAMAAKPRATRFVQAMLVSVTISDFLQQVYAAVRKLSR